MLNIYVKMMHLFTVKSRPPGAMHLRQCGHDFILPNIKYEFTKCHFFARFFFGYVQTLCACMHILSFNFTI